MAYLRPTTNPTTPSVAQMLALIEHATTLGVPFHIVPAEAFARHLCSECAETDVTPAAALVQWELPDGTIRQAPVCTRPHCWAVCQAWAQRTGRITCLVIGSAFTATRRPGSVLHPGTVA